MQDRPTALELMDAITAFLSDEIAPDLTGRKRFHMRVVLNALGILRREIDSEDDALREEWALLNGLLGDETMPDSLNALREATRARNTTLADAIRNGAMDDRWDDTLTALRTIVRRKLAIANPGYASETSADGGPTR